MALGETDQLSLQSWHLTFACPVLEAALQIAHLLFLVLYPITFPDFIPIIVPARGRQMMHKREFSLSDLF